MDEINNVVNTFKTFNQIYEMLECGDFSVISRKCGTIEYPQIKWLNDYLLENEEYEKCEFLKNIKLPIPTIEKINEELEWLKLNT